MNKVPLISIIMPIYNVEKYVRGTLESIYGQKFDEREFEVICVNDGTPDNSMQIVNDFAPTHPNLHIINQENQGLSCARNAGLRIAQGDYIWFVDSDDSIEKNALAEVSCIIKKADADIYGFNMTCVSEANSTEAVQNIVLKKRDAFLYGKCWSKENFVYKIHTAPVQRFVFRHDFIKKNELSFYPHILHEDVEFIARAFCLADKVAFFNVAPYRYLLRSSGSIMSSINMHSFHDRIIIIQSLHSFRQSLSEKSSRFFIDVMVMDVLFGLVSSMNQNSDSYRQFLCENMSSFRRLAFVLIPSACYYFSIVKLFKLFLLWVYPRLFRCIFYGITMWARNHKRD